LLRPLKNGKGTFQKIIDNLRDISRLPSHYNFLIILRVNFNEKTATHEKINEFLDYLQNTIDFNERFVVNPHVIADWSGNTTSNESIVDAKIVRRYESAVISKRLNPFSMLNYSSPESNSCYADKRNSFVVFPSTSSPAKDVLPIQKCTVSGIYLSLGS
jgi:uncharacterized protein